MHGGVRGGTYHRIFSPFSPLASVRPALAAAVAASCVEALKKKKKREPQNEMYVVPISGGNAGHKKSTTACAMGRLDLNIRYPCLDSRSAPPPCALQLNIRDGRNKYPNEEEQSDAVRAHTPKKEKGREGNFFMRDSSVLKSA